MPDSILIGKRISLPQCGSVRLFGLVGNSMLSKGEDLKCSSAVLQGVWEAKTIAFAIRSVDRSLFVRLILLSKGGNDN